MSVCLSTGLGRYVANETDVYVVPRGYQTGSRMGIVWCHTTGEDAKDAMNQTVGEALIVCALAEQFPVYVPDLGVPGAAAPNDGKNTWGNSTAMSRIQSAITWMQTNTTNPVAKAGKVAIIGCSMGAVNALNFTAANPGLVSCHAGILPVSNLTNFYNENRGGSQSLVAGAWGVTAPNPLPANADPAVAANNLPILSARTPVHAYYMSDDTAAVPAEVVSLYGTRLAGKTINMGAGGHNEMSIGMVSPADLLSFIGQFA